MGTQLDLDDVAATSGLATKELAELRAQIAAMQAVVEAARELRAAPWDSSEFVSAVQDIQNALFTLDGAK